MRQCVRLVFLMALVAFIFGASADYTLHPGTANTVKTVCKGNYVQATYQGREDRNQVNAIFRQKNIKTAWMPYHRSIHPHWLWANNTRADNQHILRSIAKASACAYIYLSVDSRELGSCSSEGYGYICEGKGQACTGDGIARGDCLVKGDRWFVYGCDVNNWYEARYRCEQMGTELATITSDQFIRDFKTQWIDNQKKKCVELWYGLHRESWGLNRTIEDQDDVSPSIHLLWDKGEPGDVNNCSVLHRDQREVTSLRSADCVSEHEIICLSEKVPGTMLEPKTTTVTSVSTPPIPCTACPGLLVAVILLSLILGLIAICLASFFFMREYCGETLCFSQTFGRICGSKDKKKPKQVSSEELPLSGSEQKSTDIAVRTPKTPDKKIVMPADDTLSYEDDTDSPGKPIQREDSTPQSEKQDVRIPSTSATVLYGAVGFDMKTIKPAVFTNITRDADETKVQLLVYAIDEEKEEKEIIENIDIEEPWIRQPSYIDISLDENSGGKLSVMVEPDASGWRLTPKKETESVTLVSIFNNYKKNKPWKLLLDRCLTGPRDSNNLVITISYTVHQHEITDSDWQNSTISVNLEQCSSKKDKIEKMAMGEKDLYDVYEELNIIEHGPNIDLRDVKGLPHGESKPETKGIASVDVNTTAAQGMTQTGSTSSRRADNVGIPVQCENNDSHGNVGSTDSGEEDVLPESVGLLNEEKESSK